MNRPIIRVVWTLAMVLCALQATNGYGSFWFFTDDINYEITNCSFLMKESSAAGTDDGICTEEWDTCRTTYNPQNVLTNLAREQNPKIVVPNTLPLNIDVSHLDPIKCVTQTDTGTAFYGYRVVHQNGTSDVIGLYNTRGHFCGIQARFPQYEILTPENPARYDLLPMFQTEIVNDDKYFVLTAYTCDPATICKEGGRPNSDPKDQVGDRLVFQNGPDPTLATNVIIVPKRRKDALKIGFSDDNCFLGMGQHTFYRVNTWTPTNCTQILPAFLLQNKCGYLIGFAFFWIGRSTSEFFEAPTRAFIKEIVGGGAPQCALDITDRESGGIGLTSIHILFTKKTQFCGRKLTAAEVTAVFKQLSGRPINHDLLHN